MDLTATARVSAAVLITALAFVFLMGTSCSFSEDSENANYWFRSGKIHSNAGVFSEAIDCFSKAISIDPEMADAYYYRGYCHYRMVQYDQAISDFKNTLKLGTNYSEKTYYYMGRTYYKMENYEEAIKSFTNAIEINPEEADYYYKRASSYYNLNIIDEAEKDYREACGLGKYDGCIRVEWIYEDKMEKKSKEKNSLDGNK